MIVKYRKNDGRPYVMKKGPKLFVGGNRPNEDTPELGYKEAMILKDLSLAFAGVDVSDRVFQMNRPKKDIWYRQGPRGSSTLSSPTYFKGKDGLDYYVAFWDTENPKGKTIVVGLAYVEDIDKWKRLKMKESSMSPNTSVTKKVRDLNYKEPRAKRKGKRQLSMDDINNPDNHYTKTLVKEAGEDVDTSFTIKEDGSKFVVVGTQTGFVYSTHDKREEAEQALKDQAVAQTEEIKESEAPSFSLRRLFK